MADGIHLKCAITDELVNVKNNLHGGITFCALEVAGTRAAWAVEPEGRFTTVTVDALYLRGVPLGRDLTCAAQVVHSGRSITVVRVEAYVEKGRPIAVATLMRHRSG